MSSPLSTPESEMPDWESGPGGVGSRVPEGWVSGALEQLTPNQP